MSKWYLRGAIVAAHQSGEVCKAISRLFETAPASLVSTEQTLKALLSMLKHWSLARLEKSCLDITIVENLLLHNKADFENFVI